MTRAPSQRTNHPALNGEIPKTGGRGKPLPYEMDGDKSCGGGRAAAEGRPYGVFNSPIWFRRNRRGFMAEAAIVLCRTEIAP